MMITDQATSILTPTVLVIDKKLADQLTGQRLSIIENQSGGPRLHLDELA